jgi:hypothetical protein
MPVFGLPCPSLPYSPYEAVPDMKKLLPLALFLAFASGQAIAAGSNVTDTHTKRVVKAERHASDIEGADWVASYEAGPLPVDYHAETACSLPLNDPYVVQRDADKGLVFRKDQRDRRVKQYTVAGARIRAIVRVKYDMDVLDRADLVFTDRPNENLILVHTTTENAGIFTSSDVYPLAYRDGKVIDKRHLVSDPALTHMLTMGVSLYREAAPASAHPRRKISG